MQDLIDRWKQRIVRGIERRRLWRELARESAIYREAMKTETSLIRDAIKGLRKEMEADSV